VIRVGLHQIKRASIAPPEQRVVRTIIEEEFVFAFRPVMIGAAGLGVATAGFGNAIRRDYADG
jgi:hypothetical protein